MGRIRDRTPFSPATNLVARLGAVSGEVEHDKAKEMRARLLLEELSSLRPAWLRPSLRGYKELSGKTPTQLLETERVQWAQERDEMQGKIQSLQGEIAALRDTPLMPPIASVLSVADPLNNISVIGSPGDDVAGVLAVGDASAAETRDAPPDNQAAVSVNSESDTEVTRRSISLYRYAQSHTPPPPPSP